MSIRVIASEHLIDANNDLQAQNERQRKQLASLNAAYGRIKSENDQLKAENAKLRELVHDMFGAYERVVWLLPDSYLKSVSNMGAMDFRERIQELESKAIK